MAFPYTNAQDARQHLHNTYILFDRAPAHVVDIHTNDTGGLEVVLDLMIGNSITVSLWDTRIQTRNFPLGYVNLAPGAVYLTRIPRRQYQQGLSDNNVITSNGENFRRIARSKGFREAMAGKYPSVPECLEIIKSKESAAFSVDFCLRRMNSGLVEVQYQNTPIGVFIDNQFVLGPTFKKWLTKYLPKEYVNERRS